MAFPTAVNDQITDAVTQGNVKVIAESPAAAMSTIYQAIAHSTGILFENAVAAQQQQNTLAQAAANQGVMQLFSVDTAAAGADGQNAFAENLAGLLAVLDAFRPSVATASAAQAETVQADTTRPATAGAHASGTDGDSKTGSDDISKALKDAVRFANDTVLGHADDFNAALRQCTDSFIHALRQVQEAESDALRRMLVDAALVAVMKALLQEPGSAKACEEAMRTGKQAT